MGRIRFVIHRDQRVLLADLTDCDPEQLTDNIDKVPQFVTKEPPESILLVADFSGSQFSRETVEHLKIAAVFDRPHLKKAAWVLSENLPKALYDSVKTFSARQIPVFSTREEAMDFVVS